MSKEIKINHAAIEAGVNAISGAAHYFEAAALTPVDDQSTITANARGQEAYASSQKIMQSLRCAMEQETSNIKSLGVAFREYDKQMSRIWEEKTGSSK